MKIYTIHNKKELELLRTKLKPFDFSKTTRPELRKIIQEMRKTMVDADGIGLSANQAGMDKAFFVARNEGKFYAIFNPKIEKTFGKKVLMEEGCLSVPNIYGLIERYEKVTLSGEDQAGKKMKIKAWGLLAQLFQHETDHLLGRLYIDKAKKTFDIKDLEE